jgi:hypothetical protein
VVKVVNNARNGAAERVAASCGEPNARNIPQVAAPEILSSGVQESTKRDSVEPHKIHWLWNETMTRLERLHKRVCEGKHVDEASEFARWLRFSGLLDIFRIFKASEPLEVDVAKVDKLIVDVLFECEQFWKRNPRGPWVSLSELEAINQKLDLLAARISQMPVAEPAQAVLRVLPEVRSSEAG